MSADRLIHRYTHTHTHIRQLMSYELVYTSIHSSINKCTVTNNFDFVAVIRYANNYFMIKFIIGMCNVLSLLLSTWTDHKTHINTSK